MLSRVEVKSNQGIGLGGDIYEMILDCGENLPQISPGQFINIYPSNPLLTLPRPISICDVQDGLVKILYQVVGKGTEEFSRYTAGTQVQVMLPLGKGYEINQDDSTHILIGGGIGVPPLLYLARQLQGTVKVFLGFKRDVILEQEFKTITPHVYIATEDGSQGVKGNVIDLLERYDMDGQQYYSCGPVPMLKAVCAYIEQKGARGQISLEARMACGFGACVGCAVKVHAETAEGGWQYLKACKDGPVFNYKEVLWD